MVDENEGLKPHYWLAVELNSKCELQTGVRKCDLQQCICSNKILLLSKNVALK